MVRLSVGVGVNVSIGLLLSIFGIFNGATSWLALFVCMILARFRFERVTRVEASEQGITRAGVAAMTGIVSYIAWPSVINTVSDGDTLIYHLPNAHMWLSSGSLWHTDTYYWWYPPASEMLAATLWAACGPPALPLPGAVGAALLAATIYDVAFKITKYGPIAFTLAASFITANLAAVQARDLQSRRQTDLLAW